MPRQNRVLATGDIVADPARGLFMGNRGILHDEQGRLGRARWRHRAWICCLLEFKRRRRTLMAPGRYTELFFLDEAVALAAGHRPCAECRREAYLSYRAAIGHDGSAADLDRRLHSARVTRDRRQVRLTRDIRGLPGSFVLVDGAPSLVLGAFLRPVQPGGYGAGRGRPRSGDVTVLTPEPSLVALAGGYEPVLHPSL